MVIAAVAADLHDVAARLAAEVDVLANLRPGAGRWWERAAATPAWDAWLLGWPPGTGIELHDHGPSAGVIQVLAGRLLETYLAPRPTRRRLEPGSRTWLPPGHVHELANHDGAPALSVHVYAPPLENMTFYP